MEPAAKRIRSDGAEDFGKLTMRQCTHLLKPLLKAPEAIYFNALVDPIRLGIPDYPNHHLQSFRFPKTEILLT